MEDESAKRKRPTHVAGDYEVGYAKPPVSGQFGRGRPGNRNGRPRQARTVQEAIYRSLQREMTGKNGRRVKPRTWAELIAEQIVIGAANGDQNMIGELQAYLPAGTGMDELKDQEERSARVTQIVVGIYELADQRKELALWRMVARDLADVLRSKDKWASRDIQKDAWDDTRVSPIAYDTLSPLELSLGPWLRESGPTSIGAEEKEKQ